MIVSTILAVLTQRQGVLSLAKARQTMPFLSHIPWAIPITACDSPWHRNSAEEMPAPSIYNPSTNPAATFV